MGLGAMGGLTAFDRILGDTAGPSEKPEATTEPETDAAT
jgi:hypothetical protein